MKYIEAERITAGIDKIIDGLKKNCNPNPLGTVKYAYGYECRIKSEKRNCNRCRYCYFGRRR